MSARSKPSGPTGNESRPDAAVALLYRPVMDAPIIAASVRGKAAQRAVDIAHASGVPVVQDPAATAALLPLELGQLVPPEYWELVARVFVVMAGLERRRM